MGSWLDGMLARAYNILQTTQNLAFMLALLVGAGADADRCGERYKQTLCVARRCSCVQTVDARAHTSAHTSGTRATAPTQKVLISGGKHVLDVVDDCLRVFLCSCVVRVPTTFRRRPSRCCRSERSWGWDAVCVGSIIKPLSERENRSLACQLDCLLAPSPGEEVGGQITPVCECVEVIHE